MRYYTVPKTGSGVSTVDSIRPEVPVGTPWIGRDNPDGTYLIATPHPLPLAAGRTEHLPVQALANACKARGLNYREVTEFWRV